MAFRIGIVGTGGIGQGHIKRVNEHVMDAYVSAVYDWNQDVCRKVAAECGAKPFDNGHDLINSPDVDAVIIACADPGHEEYSVAAIQAGKYVLCEKPLSDTVEGCERIMEAEMAGGKRLLSVGFMRRFDKDYRDMKQLIDNDVIGRPLVVHAQHRNAAPTFKFTTEMSATNALVHEFDVTRFLIGDDDEYVSAYLVCPRPSRYAEEGFLDPQCVYLKTKNGVCIDLEFYMTSRYGYDIKCEIVGEKGTVSLPAPSHTVVRYDGGIGYEMAKTWEKRFGETYVTEIQEWVQAVREGKTVGASAWDGYIASKVADACLKSLQGGGIVEIPTKEKPEFYK